MKGRRVSRAMVAMGLGPLVGKAFRRRGEIKSLRVIKVVEVSAEERRPIGLDLEGEEAEVVKPSGNQKAHLLGMWFSQMLKDQLLVVNQP